jgi:gluconokinase
MPTAGQADIADFRAILIVTGVSGSGKTTIATALGQRLGWPLQEGDELHPPLDIAKTHFAHPLDDRERYASSICTARGR